MYWDTYKEKDIPGTPENMTGIDVKMSTVHLLHERVNCAVSLGHHQSRDGLDTDATEAVRKYHS